VRLSQTDGSVYGELKVDSSGDITITPSGDEVFIPDDNLRICSGGACPSPSYSGTGNLQVEGEINIGSAVVVPIGVKGSSYPSVRKTSATYDGNLGGRSGADSKCENEFGPGWKFASCGTTSGSTGAIYRFYDNWDTKAWVIYKYFDGSADCSGGNAWCDDVDDCDDWTSNSDTVEGSQTGTDSCNLGIKWDGWYCNESHPLLCVYSP